MPKAHRAHLEWSPSRLIRWGATIGRHAEARVQPPSDRKPRPYDDEFDPSGFLRYRYRGNDPAHRDNAGLREAMKGWPAARGSLVGLAAPTHQSASAKIK